MEVRGAGLRSLQFEFELGQGAGGSRECFAKRGLPTFVRDRNVGDANLE